MPPSKQPLLTLADCWAKTDTLTGLPALTVRDHCLIVGVVAEAVRAALPDACRPLPPSGAVTLTAAHDIGKITPGFLRKCALSQFAEIPGSQHCCGNHALVGQAFLASLHGMQDERGIPHAWALSVGGHHGSYPTTKARNNLGRGKLTELDLPWPDHLRHELISELLQTFGPLPHEPITTGSRLHWLTGFIIFCDWIGSNTDWFPLHPSTSLKDHATPEKARAGATLALDRIGWHRRSVASGQTFSQLFAPADVPTFQPRPLQETLISLCDQPGLYIVEAPMGAGKTEAALAAAYRRWTEGKEAGLYFALPTQLTSNRIHERVSDFLDRIIAEETSQTLVHGNAWLSEERIRSFSPASTTSGGFDATAAQRWFTSSRKPLLAPFGTGTIDQALMACISAKHSALRLFALSGKVIVIDEVHSYDPYTSALVDQLIQWLLEVGCTVIVLSATLTAKRRREMIEKCGAIEPFPAPASYPLITKVAGNTAAHHPVHDPSITETTVTLKHLGNLDSDFIPAAARAAESGACVLIIRNSVASAQATYRAIKSALTDDTLPVGLLHSRFPHFKRQTNEGNWMEKLGKSQIQRPAGCVLIATQVVEQSVDIDADLLITDLAPTDLLLQRLGRLHRHNRDTRPSGFQTATCWILHPSPDWNASPKDIKSAIGASAFIYPPISLYHAQQTWRARQTVSLPGEIRTLLESAASSTAPLPPGAAAFAEELTRDTANMLSRAAYQGPFVSPEQLDTEGAQTRYNMQPSTLLVLLKEAPRTHGHQTHISPIHGETKTLHPGQFHYDLAKQLHENAVRIPRYLVAAAIPHQPEWLAQHMHGAVLAITSPTSTRLEIIGGANLAYALHHHPDQGISHEKTENRPPTHQASDEFDSWF